MPPAYEITFDGKEPVLKKGKLEPVKITVDTRTGNKKVFFTMNYYLKYECIYICSCICIYL